MNTAAAAGSVNSSSSIDKLVGFHNNNNKTDSYYGEDEHPPVLEPEQGTNDVEEVHRHMLAGDDGLDEEVYSLQEQGEDMNGPYLIREEDLFVDDGVLYHQKSSANHGQHQQRSAGYTQKTEPSHHHYAANHGPIDETNICCGLCGRIVPYASLVTEHLPSFHPEVLAEGLVDLEEIPMETWLNEQNGANGQDGLGRFEGTDFAGPSSGSMSADHAQQIFRPVHSTRHLRRISQYRVNTAEMDIPELELGLQKKMVEKIGRKVPVTLVDKLHAKCGICDAIISLNKKFEIAHLVRHFNSWHPSSHKCAGTWPNKELPPAGDHTSGKPLSAQDFAVIDTNLHSVVENLQCIWCGMFLSNKLLGMHFHEVHPEEVEVPKCNLCMEELLINARLAERFGGEDFGVTLPDEHTYRSIRFKRDFKSVAAMERAIIRYLNRIEEGCDPNLVDIEDLDPMDEEEIVMTPGSLQQQMLPSCEAFANSRMKCGRRSKPKRQFVMPVVRQAAPLNSRLVRAITHSHWKCKLCKGNIYAAVISAGVIKHYKHNHPELLPEIKFELCEARLEKISDGNMTIVGGEKDRREGNCLIECHLCHRSFPMTPPFNICRAVRHIKMMHPEVMPEHKGGETTRDNFPTEQDLEEDSDDDHEFRFNNVFESVMETVGCPSTSSAPPANDAAFIKIVNHVMEDGVIYATELLDPAMIQMLRTNYNADFDRVYSVYGKEINQEIFILTMAGDQLDTKTVDEIVKVRDPEQNPMVVILNRQIDKQG